MIDCLPWWWRLCRCGGGRWLEHRCFELEAKQPALMISGIAQLLIDLEDGVIDFFGQIFEVFEFAEIGQDSGPEQVQQHLAGLEMALTIIIITFNRIVILNCHQLPNKVFIHHHIIADPTPQYYCFNLTPRFHTTIPGFPSAPAPARLAPPTQFPQRCCDPPPVWFPPPASRFHFSILGWAPWCRRLHFWAPRFVT